MELNLENVIDKLSSKIGIAIDKIKPITDEILRQYLAGRIVYIIMWSIFCFISFFAALCFFRKVLQWRAYNKQLIEASKKHANANLDNLVDDDAMFSMILGSVLCFMFSVLSLVCTCICIVDYVSPLVQLLKL